mgnify:CR=1 FL=1
MKFPNDCPLASNDYATFCPAPIFGPLMAEVNGKCHRYDDCCNIAKSLLEDNVARDSEVAEPMAWSVKTKHTLK